jgi:DNA adenine methylase
VISCLGECSRERSFFESMRERDIVKESDVQVAAWFIFLNKTGFNGLYRVNSQNKFNVPYGDHKKNARFFDEANLRACATALQSATIEHRDFAEALREVEPGDFVYLDPPYVPLSVTSNFTSYTAEGFTHRDQERLRDAALELKKRGVHVVLSNSSSAAYLYEDGFDTIEVLASRPVNSRGDRRGKITELLIV